MQSQPPQESGTLGKTAQENESDLCYLTAGGTALPQPAPHLRPLTFPRVRSESPSYLKHYLGVSLLHHSLASNRMNTLGERDELIGLISSAPPPGGLGVGSASPKARGFIVKGEHLNEKIKVLGCLGGSVSEAWDS